MVAVPGNSLHKQLLYKVAIAILATWLCALWVGGAVIAADKPITLQFWHIWSDQRRPILRQVLDRFEATHPGVKVEDVLMASTTERIEKIMTSAAAGVPPDVGMIQYDEAFRLSRLGFMEPLTKHMQADKVTLSRLMYPAIAQAVTIDNDYYFLPQLMSTTTLMHANADMMEMAGLDSRHLPTTFPELEQAAKKMTRSEGGQVTQIGMDVLGGPLGEQQLHALTSWLHILGGSIFDASGRKVTLNSPAAQKALSWMSDFNTKVVGSSADLLAFSRMNGYNQISDFEKGKVGFLMQADYIYAYLRGRKPDLNITMGVIPHDPTLGPRTYVGPGWGYGVFKDSKHPHEAWELLRWLTLEVEGGGAFAISQGRATTLPAVNRQRSYYDKHPYWEVILQTFEQSATVNPGPPGLQIGDDLLRLSKDALFDGRLSVGDALAEAQRTIQAKVNEWWKQEDGRK